MYDDVLGEDKKEAELFTEEMYTSWCAVYCLIQLNDMVDKGVLEMSDGGEPPMVITEKGEMNCMKYFREFKGREPNEEDMKVGMAVLKNEGLW